MRSIIPNRSATKPRVVIIGGGFAGLYAARALKKADIDIILIDKKNFHLFQPLLYQVATGAISPGDIAVPIRHVLSKQQNLFVLQEEVLAIDQNRKILTLKQSEVKYDFLAVAAGVDVHYFGNPDWAKHSFQLKSLEDAIKIRNHLLSVFEKAEAIPPSKERDALMTFAIIGGGPTGVELTGAIAELARHTLKKDFKNIDPTRTRIILIEAAPQILPFMHSQLAKHAQRVLTKWGVEVMDQTRVIQLTSHRVILQQGNDTISLNTQNVIWAAGIRGVVFDWKNYPFTDKSKRIITNGKLEIPDNPDVFILGDLGNGGIDGKSLEAVAPAAIQQGRYFGKYLKARLKNKSIKDFKYFNKGNLAVIGRGQAVAEIGKLRIKGFPAWLIWIFIHITFLIGFDNKILVLFQWAWNYFTKKRTSRIIFKDLKL